MKPRTSKLESGVREQVSRVLASYPCPPELADLFTTFLVTGSCNPRSLLMARTGGGPINDLRWDLFRFLVYTQP